MQNTDFDLWNCFCFIWSYNLLDFVKKKNVELPLTALSFFYLLHSVPFNDVSFPNIIMLQAHIVIKTDSFQLPWLT